MYKVGAFSGFHDLREKGFPGAIMRQMMERAMGLFEAEAMSNARGKKCLSALWQIKCLRSVLVYLESQ